MGRQATPSPPHGRGGASRRAPCSRPASLPLSPPLLQHRGQLPPARRRPARPTRSREPRILALPRSALSPARGGSAPTWGSGEGGPRLPPPAATACLSPPCSLPRSRISPPGTPDPAPGRGGAGRGGAGSRGARRRRRRREGRAAGTGFSASWSQTLISSPSPLPPVAHPRSDARGPWDS